MYYFASYIRMFYRGNMCLIPMYPPLNLRIQTSGFSSWFRILTTYPFTYQKKNGNLSIYHFNMFLYISQGMPFSSVLKLYVDSTKFSLHSFGIWAFSPSKLIEIHSIHVDMCGFISLILLLLYSIISILLFSCCTFVRIFLAYTLRSKILVVIKYRVFSNSVGLYKSFQRWLH